MPQPAAVIPVSIDASAIPAQFAAAINRAYQSAPTLQLKIDSRPLGKISGDLREFDKSLAASNARVIAFGATTGVLYSMISAFRGLVETTIEVDKQLTNIQSILHVSQGGFENLKKSLFDIAGLTQSTFGQAAEAAANFARQGLSMTETLKRTRDSLIIARETGISVAEVFTSMTAAINTFRNEALDSTTIMNKLVAVSTNFAVTSGDLTEAIQRAGAVAKDAGVNFDSLVAAVTAAQTATARGGAVIGNAFKSIFTRVERTETIIALEKLGVATKSATGASLSAIQVLQNLAQTYNTLSESQKNQATRLIAGTQQVNIAKALLNDLARSNSVYASSLAASSNATDEGIRRIEEMNKSLSALANKAQQSGTAIAAAIGGKTIEPGLRTLLTGINTFFDKINEIRDGGGIGEKLGKGILDGIGSALKGPGAVLFFSVFINIFSKVALFAKNSLGELAGLNKNAREQEALQGSLNKLLAQGNSYYKERFQQAQTVQEQEKIILQLIKEENAALQIRQASFAGVAAGLGSRGVRTGGNGGFTGVPTIAGGYVPNAADGLVSAYVQEKASVSRGVGGASSSARPVVIPHFSMGGGKNASVVANSDEYIIKNYAGGTGSAIFNPQMVQMAGGMNNLQKLGHVQKIAAKGFIPNFDFPDFEKNFRIHFGSANPKAFKPDYELHNNPLGIIGSSPLLQSPKIFRNVDITTPITAKALDSNTSDKSRFHALSALKVRLPSSTIVGVPASPTDELYQRIYKEVLKDSRFGTDEKARGEAYERYITESFGLDRTKGGAPFDALAGSRTSSDFLTKTNRKLFEIKSSLGVPLGNFEDVILRNKSDFRSQAKVQGTTVEDIASRQGHIATGNVDFGHFALKSLRAQIAQEVFEGRPHVSAEKALNKFGFKVNTETLEAKLRGAILRGENPLNQQFFNTDLFTEKARGYVPNYADFISSGKKGDYSVIRGITSDGERLRHYAKNELFDEHYRYSTPAGSSVKFRLGENNLAIQSLDSEKKGDGTKMFAKIAQYAKKRGLGIYSDELISQNIGETLTAKNLYELFPQIKIREKLGLHQTSGELSYSAPQDYATKSFKSIPHLKRLIASGKFVDPTLTNLTTTLAGGYIPNFAPLADFMSIFGGAVTPENGGLAKITSRGTRGAAIRNVIGLHHPDLPENLLGGDLKKLLANSPTGILKTLISKGFIRNAREEDVDALQELSGGRDEYLGPLKEAIRREKKAVGSGVYVDSNDSLANSRNPLGLMVANRRDEPLGGIQGISRARSEGQDPRFYGAAGGLIPNFASPYSVPELGNLLRTSPIAKEVAGGAAFRDLNTGMQKVLDDAIKAIDLSKLDLTQSKDTIKNKFYDALKLLLPLNIKDVDLQKSLEGQRIQKFVGGLAERTFQVRSVDINSQSQQDAKTNEAQARTDKKVAEVNQKISQLQQQSTIFKEESRLGNLRDKIATGAPLAAKEYDTLHRLTEQNIARGLGINSPQDLKDILGARGGARAYDTLVTRGANQQIAKQIAQGNKNKNIVDIGEFFDQESGRRGISNLFGAGVERRFNKRFSGVDLSDSDLRQIKNNGLAAQRRERNDRLQGFGLQASFALPLLAQTALSFGGVDTSFGRGKAISGAVEGLSTGATIASIAPGPQGLAAGAVVGGFLALKSVVSNLSKSFEQLTREASEAANKRHEEVVAVNGVIQSYETLKTAYGQSPQARNRAALEFTNATSQLNPTDREKVRNIFSTTTGNKRDEALQDLQANLSIESVRSDRLSQAGLVGANIDDKTDAKGFFGLLSPSNRNLFAARDAVQGGGLRGLAGSAAFTAFNLFSGSRSGIDPSTGRGYGGGSLEDVLKGSSGPIKPEFKKKFEESLSNLPVGDLSGINFSDDKFNASKQGGLNAFTNILAATNTPQDKIEVLRKQLQQVSLRDFAFTEDVYKKVIANMEKSQHDQVIAKAGQDLEVDRNRLLNVSRDVLTDVAHNFQIGTGRDSSRRQLGFSVSQGLLGIESPTLSATNEENVKFRNSIQEGAGAHTDALNDIIHKGISKLDLPEGALNDTTTRRQVAQSVRSISNDPSSIFDELKKLSTIAISENKGEQDSRRLLEAAKEIARGIDVENEKFLAGQNKVNAEHIINLERINKEQQASFFGGDFTKLVNPNFTTAGQGFNALGRGVVNIRQAGAAVGLGDELLRNGLLDNDEAGRNKFADIARRGAIATQNRALDRYIKLARRSGQGDIADSLEGQRGRIDDAASEQAARRFKIGGASLTKQQQDYNEQLIGAGSDKLQPLEQNTSALLKTIESLNNLSETLNKIEGEESKDKAPETPDVGAKVASARGFIPNFSAWSNEVRDIRAGVGGATAGDRPVWANVNGLGRTVVNSGESIIRNFLGSNKDAVFNRQMMNAVGGGLGSLGNVQSAAGGFIPNFGDTDIDLSKVPEDYLAKMRGVVVNDDMDELARAYKKGGFAALKAKINQQNTQIAATQAQGNGTIANKAHGFIPNFAGVSVEDALALAEEGTFDFGRRGRGINFNLPRRYIPGQGLSRNGLQATANLGKFLGQHDFGAGNIVESRGGLRGLAALGQNSIFVNLENNLTSGARRETIAHEAFHASNPILGKSEFLADFYGGFRAPKTGNLLSRIGSGASTAYNSLDYKFNKALTTENIATAYKSLDSRVNRVLTTKNIAKFFGVGEKATSVDDLSAALKGGTGAGLNKFIGAIAESSIGKGVGYLGKVANKAAVPLTAGISAIGSLTDAGNRIPQGGYANAIAGRGLSDALIAGGALAGSAVDTLASLDPTNLFLGSGKKGNVGIGDDAQFNFFGNAGIGKRLIQSTTGGKRYSTYLAGTIARAMGVEFYSDNNLDSASKLQEGRERKSITSSVKEAAAASANSIPDPAIVGAQMANADLARYAADAQARRKGFRNASEYNTFLSTGQLVGESAHTGSAEGWIPNFADNSSLARAVNDYPWLGWPDRIGRTQGQRIRHFGGITGAKSRFPYGPNLARLLGIAGGADSFSNTLFDRLLKVGPGGGQALDDAIDREASALKLSRGIPSSLARGYIFAGSNPSIGMGVGNYLDEPAGRISPDMGILQGITRVIRQGGNPRASGASGGYVPNYASGDNSDLTSAMKALTAALNNGKETTSLKQSNDSNGVDVNHAISANVNISIGGAVQGANEALQTALQEGLASLKADIERKMSELQSNGRYTPTPPTSTPLAGSDSGNNGPLVT